MSEQVQTHKKSSSTSSPAFTPRSDLIQRKCACGGSAGVDGECAECRSKSLSVQRSPVTQAELAASVPPVVHDVLSSPGQPLDSGTRAYMEPRFGHDFSQVRVHADGKAAESAQAINALAYTAGRDIAFGEGQYEPETTEGKKLLAHELTHVVQQSTELRASIPARVTASISDPSDSFERTADYAAAMVTSEGSISTQIPIVSGGSPSIQRQSTLHKPTEKTETDEQVASSALRAVADVLQHGQLRLLGGVDPKYHSAILELQVAQVGINNGKKVPATERLLMFEAALSKLHPAFIALERDREQRGWLATEVSPYVDQLRDNLNLAKARERVERAEIGPGNKIIEIPQGGDPRAEAAALHVRIPKLVQTIVMIHEQGARLGEALHEGAHAIEHELESAHIPQQMKKKGFDFGMLEEMQNVLYIVDAFLTLTDEEFQYELGHIHGIFPGVASYAELIKAISELVGGTVGATASFAALVAKASGQITWAIQASDLARETSGLLGNVIAAIEILHGIAVLLDSHAGDKKKEEAVRDIAVGSAWFGGRLATGAAAGGFAASTAVLITYYELKLTANLYGQARTGIMGGWMNNAFETMNDAAQNIGVEADELAKAGLLLAAEKEPQQQRALGAVQTEHTIKLGRTIDYFLYDCKPVGYGPGAAYKPGAYEILRREFSPLLPLEGAKTSQATAMAAIAVLKKIHWCFEHARELLREASGLSAKEGGTEEHKADKGGAHE